jgi:autoinducer 2-degrading protein
MSTVPLPNIHRNLCSSFRQEIQIRIEGMLIIHVQIHVKPESVDAFKQATAANARESRLEPGVARFDCLQRLDDPTRFVLVEAYRFAEAQAQHRETRHYQTWRNTVEGMMAEPRTSERFAPALPDDQGG